MGSRDKDSTGLEALQKLIDRSAASAGPAAADSLAFPGRQMSAAEFVEFWQSVRLVAMATVGETGAPHLAPVHARLDGTRASARDLRQHVAQARYRSQSQVAFTTWRADGAAAIVYGIAHEVVGSLRAARAGQSGKPRQVIELEVKLTRIYAMRPPDRAP